LNGPESQTLAAFKENPNMNATQAAEVFCEKYERPGVVAMGDRTSAANQFAQLYADGGKNGATAMAAADAPPVSGFNNQLVAAVEKQDAQMGGTGLCATAVQNALAACGKEEFMGSGNGWDMGQNLLKSGQFEAIPLSEARPGDILARSWSAEARAENGGNNYGDISVVTARNGGHITQTNDATYEFQKDNPRYSQTVAMRYVGDDNKAERVASKDNDDDKKHNPHTTAESDKTKTTKTA
jgi:hypothetical protein